MRLTDAVRIRWLRGLVIAACVSLMAVNPGSSEAKVVLSELCDAGQTRTVVAELVGEWAQKYPFARVLIGEDGRFGSIGEPRVYMVEDSAVACLASYSLVRSNHRGGAYNVSIDSLKYRITRDRGNGVTLTLLDLPLSLEGTGLTIADLIARFSVDGQPYADVLEANRRRIVAGAR
ncbi:hypothetical protein ACOYW6_09665 [Parablastomonas sp. CN1-191]|uniref:hypothetical protein n=1 Tax=Parablastomonas sp. CN1-191 TaxID=3400908 RepID=UPI003BF8C04D